jgi:hypothetical protein
MVTSVRKLPDQLDVEQETTVIQDVVANLNTIADDRKSLERVMRFVSSHFDFSVQGNFTA